MKNNKRKVVLDIETTGMNFSGCFYKTHRIIEIGAVEIINNCVTGSYFHSYICPDRSVDDSAFKIHGISNNFLSDKPKFVEIAKEFLKYLDYSDLIIHNAKFDVSFINYELNMLSSKINNVEKHCNIIDTLVMARKIFPGKKNTLDALCSRYKINIKKKRIHSAIYDAQLLSKVYIFMTNRQESLTFLNRDVSYYRYAKKFIPSKHIQSKILLATDQENIFHKKFLEYIIQNSGKCIWMDK
ncbi:MAG: DNA polymerase III subunit epsilon [Buchnera aphidicola (Kaburagia rhusicola rhusicola)]